MKAKNMQPNYKERKNNGNKNLYMARYLYCLCRKLILRVLPKVNIISSTPQITQFLKKEHKRTIPECKLENVIEEYIESKAKIEGVFVVVTGGNEYIN